MSEVSNVWQTILISLFNGNLGVAVESEEGDNEDLVIDKNTQHEDDETAKLEPCERFNVNAVDWNEDKEDPDEEVSQHVACGSLGGGTVLGYTYTWNVQNRDDDDHAYRIENEYGVGSVIPENSNWILNNSISAHRFCIAGDELESRK